MAKAASKTQEYPVLEVFRDKETKKKYPVGSIYETDDQDRADFLKEFGYIGSPETDEAGQPDPVVTNGSDKTTGHEDKPNDDNPDPDATKTKTDGKADKE